MALDTSSTKLVDSAGVNLSTIKAASSAAVAGDTAFVVALSPNTPLPAGSNALGTVTANAGTGTMNVTGTGTAGTPASGVVTIQGASGGSAVSVSLVAPVTLFSEGTSARTTSGNTSNLTPTTAPSSMIVAWNITAVTGTTPSMTVSLQQQDANGVFQTLASSAAQTATGTGTLSVGQALANNVMISGNNITRIAWTISGVTPSFTVQFSLIAR